MVECKTSILVSPKDYVSHMTVLPTALVVGLTNSSILSMPLTLQSKSVVAQPVSDTTTAGLAPLLSTPMAVVSCDTEGRLRLWDLRAQGVQQQIDALDSGVKATSLSTSSFGDIAIGTEASPDAQILLFDARQIKNAKPTVQYTDSHNDDVTDLEFHPTKRHRMLSGSTDGVVNLFDTSISNEDDAVLEAFNHQSSIHRSGFLLADNRECVLALSHMETLTVYPISSQEEINGDVEGEKNVEYGDLRKLWQCQYVADFRKQRFLIGSNDDQWARLVGINDDGNGTLLDGGHGDEVIRCFDIGNYGECYTGGEDGCVKLWDVDGKFDASTNILPSSIEKKKSLRKQKVVKRKDPIGK